MRVSSGPAYSLPILANVSIFAAHTHTHIERMLKCTKLRNLLHTYLYTINHTVCYPNASARATKTCARASERAHSPACQIKSGNNNNNSPSVCAIAKTRVLFISASACARSGEQEIHRYWTKKSSLRCVVVCWTPPPPPPQQQQQQHDRPAKPAIMRTLDRAYARVLVASLRRVFAAVAA